MRAALRRALLHGVAAALPRVPERGGGGGERLLLVRPDHLGDVLFLTPALRALRAARPDAEITVLVGPWAAALLHGNPDVDQVETLAFPWFDRQPRRSWLDPYQRLWAGAARLRGRYEVALICRFDHWWGGWLARAAAIPRVIGFDVPGLAPFLTERVPYTPNRHEVRQTLRLTQRLGTLGDAEPRALPLRFQPGEGAQRAVQALPEGAGPLVALHPGSGAAVKRWALPHWAALMAALHAERGARFVVTGGPGERALAAELLAAAPAGAARRSLAGQTTLAELAALFAHCDLAIGPDSGPLHLAVAAGCPTVHLYGPVDPARFGPWGDAARHRVACRALACQFCNRLAWDEAQLPQHPCTTSIPVAHVLGHARALLAQPRCRP